MSQPYRLTATAWGSICYVVVHSQKVQWKLQTVKITNVSLWKWTKVRWFQPKKDQKCLATSLRPDLLGDLQCSPIPLAGFKGYGYLQAEGKEKSTGGGGQRRNGWQGKDTKDGRWKAGRGGQILRHGHFCKSAPMLLTVDVTDGRCCKS